MSGTVMGQLKVLIYSSGQKKTYHMDKRAPGLDHESPLKSWEERAPEHMSPILPIRDRMEGKILLDLDDLLDISFFKLRQLLFIHGFLFEHHVPSVTELVGAFKRAEMLGAVGWLAVLLWHGVHIRLGIRTSLCDIVLGSIDNFTVQKVLFSRRIESFSRGSHIL